MSSDSFQIYLSSKTADVYINGLSNVQFNLPIIEIDDQYHIHLGVSSASIPISYYNINNNNNLLTYNLFSMSSVSVYIPIGNYNITTFVTMLNSLLTNFTIVYVQSLNKFTFTHAASDFTISNLSTCLSLIGLTEYFHSSTSRVLHSDRCINLSPVRSFTISCNQKTGNINKALPNIQNILCSIPISANTLGIVNYDNSNNFQSNLYTNVINSICIQISDQDGNYIDFNGVNWFITLQLNIIKYVD
jgi:hypothetical protein